MKSLKRSSPNLIEAELKLAGSLDKRMINLLKAIDEQGSINQAAKQMKLSYKGAWQIIERANNLAPKILINTATGGSHGGGSSLTASGRALLELFNQLESRHQAFLDQLNDELINDHELFLLLKPLAIKTSATNQLFGRIENLAIGSVSTEVTLLLKGGEQIIASLANSEIEPLKLALHDWVLLLINSIDIALVEPGHSSKLSARNVLTGRIIRIQHDAIDAEVVIRLEGGDTLTVIITAISAKSLALTIDTKIDLMFKSNAVLICTSA